MKTLLAPLFCIAVVGAAMAQNPPPESVTVTGTKSREARNWMPSATISRCWR